MKILKSILGLFLCLAPLVAVVVSTTGEQSGTVESEAKKCEKPSENIVLPRVSVGSTEVGDTGFEPVTSTMSTWRSNQLS